jgi:hypothetical protein
MPKASREASGWAPIENILFFQNFCRDQRSQAFGLILVRGSVSFLLF